MPCSIDVKNLTKSFGTICAVDNVSFTAYPSQIITLLGPNGAGKSTLMNMIAGFLSQTKGKVEIFGKDTFLYPIETKKEIGFLPEGAPLYADMSVENFLKYLAELKSLPKLTETGTTLSLLIKGCLPLLIFIIPLSFRFGLEHLFLNE